MGVPDAAGKCGLGGTSTPKKTTARGQATLIRKKEGRGFTRPSGLGQAGDGWSVVFVFVLCSRTRVVRQCAVKGLVDVLGLAVRGWIEVRQNGPVLGL